MISVATDAQDFDKEDEDILGCSAKELNGAEDEEFDRREFQDDLRIQDVGSSVDDSRDRDDSF